MSFTCCCSNCFSCHTEKCFVLMCAYHASPICITAERQMSYKVCVWREVRVSCRNGTWRVEHNLEGRASSSSAFPGYVFGVHHSGPYFCLCDFFFFFNQAIQVATFCLCGWCMLGVFLLPALICLGHECQDLLSPCDGMHVCTLDLCLYSRLKELWGNGVRTYVNSKGKIPSPEKLSSEKDRTHHAASSRTASPPLYQ